PAACAPPRWTRVPWVGPRSWSATASATGPPTRIGPAWWTWTPSTPTWSGWPKRATWSPRTGGADDDPRGHPRHRPPPAGAAAAGGAGGRWRGAGPGSRDGTGHLRAGAGGRRDCRIGAGRVAGPRRGGVPRPPQVGAGGRRGWRRGGGRQWCGGRADLL